MLGLANSPESGVESVDKTADTGLFLPENLTDLADDVKLGTWDCQLSEAGSVIALNPALSVVTEGQMEKGRALLAVAVQELALGLALEEAVGAPLRVEAKEQSELSLDQARVEEEVLGAGPVRVGVGLSGVFVVAYI